jgi:serine/threonine protein kinase
MAAGSLTPASAVKAWRERLAAEVCEPGPLLARGYGYEIFEARLEAGADPVALKIFTSNMALHRRLPVLRMLERRASFEHPHLLGVHGVGQVAGHPFIALELLRAPTLTARVVAGAMAAAEAVRLLSGVAEAVDATVAAGMHVRDLTPAAIVVDPVRGGLLGDLGVAADVLGRVPLKADDQLAYRSPEELRRKQPSARAATYSLAAVLYAALTAEPPHSNERLRVAPQALPPPPVSSHRGHLPREIDAVIARAMAAEPARRYTSASELMRAAAHALGVAAEAEARPMPVDGAALPAERPTQTTRQTRPSEASPSPATRVTRTPMPAARPPEPEATPEPPPAVTPKPAPPPAPTPQPEPALKARPAPAAPEQQEPAPAASAPTAPAPTAPTATAPAPTAPAPRPHWPAAPSPPEPSPAATSPAAPTPPAPSRQEPPPASPSSRAPLPAAPVPAEPSPPPTPREKDPAAPRRDSPAPPGERDPHDWEPPPAPWSRSVEPSPATVSPTAPSPTAPAPVAPADRKPGWGPKAPPRIAVAAADATRHAGAFLRARAAGAPSHALPAASTLWPRLRAAAPALAVMMAIAASAGLGLVLAGGDDPAREPRLPAASTAERPVVLNAKPSPVVERLPATLKQLRRQRAAALRRLERASVPASQGRAARPLARAYRSAARATAGAPELGRLRAALRHTAAAYSRLSRAATSADRRRYAAAAATVRRAEHAVRRELASLR